MTTGLRDAVGDELSHSHLFIDFDGTLAPIVDDPASAVALPGVAAALERLVEEGCRVTVISGRPVSFLRERAHVEGVSLVGLYGLEDLIDGAVVTNEQAATWRPVIDDVAGRTDTEGPVGVDVEHKGLSLTLHYRTRPDLEDAVTAWARAEADRTGLDARAAKRSMELHPPIQVDKGVALLERVAGDVTLVIFIGDDAGDLPAFDALDRLEREGRRVVRVAVAGADARSPDSAARSDQAPSAMTERADVALADPAGVLDFLSR